MAKNITSRMVTISSSRDLANLLIALEVIPEKIRTVIIADAVRKAAPVSVASIKSFARRSMRTGALHDSIDFVVRRYEKTASAVAIVGPVAGRKKDINSIPGSRSQEKQTVPYAHLVEFGHNIVSGGSNRTSYELETRWTGKFTASGKKIFRRMRGDVKSRGTGKVIGFVPAKPFMRPGMAASASEVSRIITQEISDGLDRETSKLPK